MKKPVNHKGQNFEHHQLLNSPDLTQTPEKVGQPSEDFEKLIEIATELIDSKLGRNEEAIRTTGFSLN